MDCSDVLVGLQYADLPAVAHVDFPFKADKVDIRLLRNLKRYFIYIGLPLCGPPSVYKPRIIIVYHPFPHTQYNFLQRYHSHYNKTTKIIVLLYVSKQQIKNKVY